MVLITRPFYYLEAQLYLSFGVDDGVCVVGAKCQVEGLDVNTTTTKQLTDG